MNSSPQIFTSYHNTDFNLARNRVECDCACENSFMTFCHEPEISNSVWRKPALHKQYLNARHALFFNPFFDNGLTVMNHEAMAIWDQFDSPMDYRTLPKEWIPYAELMFTHGLLESINQENHFKFARSKYGSKTLSVWMHVTNACNLRCDYCYINKNQEHMAEEIGFAAIDSIIRSAIKGSFQRIKLKFAGGEATLNLALVYDLHDYATYETQKAGIDLDSVLLSNGVTLTSTAINTLAKHNIRVMISLDGLGEVHDSQRHFANGKGSFHQVIKTLDNLQAQDVVPFISITISDRNAQSLPETVRFLLDRDLPFNLNFFRENDCIPGGVNDLRIQDERLIDALYRSFDLIEEYLPKHSLLDSLIDRSQFYTPHNKTCSVGDSYIVIDHHGFVAKCHMDIENPVTNIFVEDPLSLVRSDTLFVQNPFVEDKEGCRECDWRYWCAGGCPLATYQATGRYDVKSPYCNIYKSIYPRLLRLEGLRLLKWGFPVLQSVQ